MPCDRFRCAGCMRTAHAPLCARPWQRWRMQCQGRCRQMLSVGTSQTILSSLLAGLSVGSRDVSHQQLKSLSRSASHLRVLALCSALQDCLNGARDVHGLSVKVKDISFPLMSQEWGWSLLLGALLGHCDHNSNVPHQLHSLPFIFPFDEDSPISSDSIGNN